MSVALPLAHAGHWLASLAYAMPPVVLLLVVCGAMVIARRQETNPDEGETKR